MSDNTHYELFYYNGRGLCEPIRYILSFAGASFTDNRAPLTSLTPLTPFPAEWKERALFGQVPMLEFDGNRLTQSQAIVRYLARKYKLVGKNELEAAKCDEINDGIRDWLQLWGPLWREQDPEKRKELIENARSQGNQRYLAKFNAILEVNGGHLVGDSLTSADICVAHYVDNVRHVTKVQVAEDYPALQSLLKTVFSTPGIKEYIEKRPHSVY